MSIWAITGNPGAGKTLFAVEMMRRFKERGKRVVANFPTTCGLCEFMLWDEMKELDNAVVVIDETHRWFNSRTYKEQTAEDLAMFAQHRKWGLEMYCVVQDEARMDVALRELVAGYWRINRIGRFARAGLHFQRNERSNKAGGIYYYLSDWHYNAYWSNLVIGDRNGRGYELGTSAELIRLGVATYYRVDIPGETVNFIDELDPRLFEILDAAAKLKATFRKVHRHPKYGMIPAILLPAGSSVRKPTKSTLIEQTVRSMYDLVA